MQQKFSYLRPKYNADFWVQRLIDEDMLEYIGNREGTSLLAYLVLLSGLHSKNESEFPPEYDTKDNRIRFAELERMSKEIGCTKNQLVLAWTMNQKTKIIPIISGSKKSQIEKSIHSTEVKISPEQIDILKKAGE